ncbi:MAG: AmmeMemoRadiSam system protein B [Candidatus Hodarchaeota archaeon]
MSRHVRRAMFAGSWYPGTEPGLKDTIEKCFLSEQGPGELPAHDFWKDNKGEVMAIISPHAGYAYSGGVASNGYLEIAKDGLPDTIVLLGSHGGFSGIYIQTEGAWESPLGTTEIDEELATKIASNSEYIEEDNKYMLSPNITDNTFELQLPFIQYLSTSIKLVPIAVGSRDAKKLKAAAGDLSDALKDFFDNSLNNTKKIVIIASTDLTHYGPRFMFAPVKGKPSKEQNEWVRNNDKKFIDVAINLSSKDTTAILDQVMKERNVCCPGAIILGLECIKQLSDKSVIKYNVQLLRQATSFDIAPDSWGSFSAVGYASIIIKKE